MHELDVDGRRHLTFDEAVPREFDVDADHMAATRPRGLFPRVLLDAIGRSDGTRNGVSDQLFRTNIKDGILEFIRDRKLEAVFHRGIALGVFRKDLQIRTAKNAGWLAGRFDFVVG